MQHIAVVIQPQIPPLLSIKEKVLLHYKPACYPPTHNFQFRQIIPWLPFVRPILGRDSDMLNARSFKATVIAASLLGSVLYPANEIVAAASSVRLEIIGNVTPSCTSSITTATFRANDITKAGSSKLSFTVDCNAPFQYSLQSDNGALRLAGAPGSATGGSVEAPYDVHIKIPLTFGGAIDDTCASGTLKQGAVSCHFSDSGRKIAVNQTAEMDISWKSPQGQLTAGQYTDRLSILVSVRP
jgi:hypothetical protein